MGGQVGLAGVFERVVYKGMVPVAADRPLSPRWVIKHPARESVVEQQRPAAAQVPGNGFGPFKGRGANLRHLADLKLDAKIYEPATEFFVRKGALAHREFPVPKLDISLGEAFPGLNEDVNRKGIKIFMGDDKTIELAGRVEVFGGFQASPGEAGSPFHPARKSLPHPVRGGGALLDQDIFERAGEGVRAVGLDFLQ